MILLNATKTAILNLTGLEIFFISTTLVSLFFNLFQLLIAQRKERALITPLTNTLIGLFNDIKSKITNVYQNQNILFSPQNPHVDISTLRWEYGQYTQSIITYMLGFQEALVGALVSLNPKDKEGKLAFKASDYGLTPEEKEQRKRIAQQIHEQQLMQQDKKD